MATINDDFQKDLDENNCCICIPLKTGLKIIAAIYFISTIIFTPMALYTLIALGDYNSLLFLIIGIPGIFVAYNWYLWLKDDNK